MSDVMRMVQGATHPTYTITFLDANRSAYDLTGATMTGKVISSSTSTTTSLTGTFALVTAASGIFSYIPSTADAALSAGNYRIQFTATYSDTTKDRTFLTSMLMETGL